MAKLTAPSRSAACWQGPRPSADRRQTTDRAQLIAGYRRSATTVELGPLARLLSDHQRAFQETAPPGLCQKQRRVANFVVALSEKRNRRAGHAGCGGRLPRRGLAEGCRRSGPAKRRRGRCHRTGRDRPAQDRCQRTGRRLSACRGKANYVIARGHFEPRQSSSLW